MLSLGLSVIIPTHKRAHILQKCLDALAEQTMASALEVIVVHDGEDDEETAKMIKGYKKQKTFETFEYFAIPKAQQGIARNRGVQKATKPIVLFIGDDIFLAPDTCERHIAAHAKLEAERYVLKAVIGYTTWDPSIDITPVMRWLERSGWQFAFPMIENYASSFVPEHIQERFTYTSNISLPIQTAKSFPFREDITMYGWEDMEWGMRLKEAGLYLFYEPAAKALHYHKITLEDSLKRIEELGKSAVILSEKVPTFDRVPEGWKFLAYNILAKLPTMAGQHRKAFLKGMKEH
jgi:glycosyltransferase involved in cell wall biosynthesis